MLGIVSVAVVSCSKTHDRDVQSRPYQPTAAVYHSHGEPLIKHLRRASRDVPTVIGNFLHLGSGGHMPKRARTGAVTRPAPD